MSVRADQNLRKIAIFTCIGVINTGLYVVISWGLQTSGIMSAALAGLLGFCAGAAFSYIANRTLTFASHAPHGAAMVKFAATSMIGLLICVGLPFLMTDMMGLHIEIPLLLAAVVTPVVNYLLLSRFVFVSGVRHSQGLP